jgi:hypothetical protein
MPGMKKQTLYRIAVSVLFLLFGSMPASAQSSQSIMSIQIPFEFQINEKLLPAGKYIIRRDQQMPQLMLIQCPEKNIWMAVHTIPHSLLQQSLRGSLVFKEYGEKRFLTEVKLPGRHDGYSLIKSKAERRLAEVTETKTIHAIPRGATTNN